jgi:uncharacterized SAM-binding protein YcdF (DUF218 family)
MRRAAGVLVLIVALAWLGGLAAFLHAIPTQIDDPDSMTDAIVVLTGGSLRVQSGLALLAAGKGKKLFVSGVYQGVEVGELLRVSRQAPDAVACCIVLGHTADNTIGNAEETAAWMHGENYRSLRLVTADYHMPRSLLEFSRLMPDVRIVANPVFPEASQERWWTHPSGVNLILGEYSKYLLALARPYLPGLRDGGMAS